MPDEKIMMNHGVSKRFWFLDYMAIPALIVFIAYQPDFIRGFIDRFEAGKELACINEVFLGKLPYKDIFIPFGPLNTYLEAFFMLLLGKNLAILIGYFYYGTIITLITGYFIGRSLCYGRFFSYAIALALIVETYHPFWATRWGGIRFGFGLLAVLCAINFFKKEKNLWAFFAGVSVMVAFLTTMDVGILSLVAISLTFCFYAVFNFARNKIFKLKGFILFFIGILVALIPFITYFIFKGAFLPYVNTLVVIAGNHTRVWGQSGISLNLMEYIKIDQIFKYNFKYIFPVLLYVYSIIYLIRRILKKTICWKDYSILCLSIYGLLMYKTAFRAMLGPQFAMSLQPAIILGFVFLEDLFNYIIKLKRRIAINKINFIKLIVFTAIFALAVSYAVFSEKRFYGSFKEWFLYQKYKSYLMPTYGGVIPVSELRFSSLTIDRAKGVIVPGGQAEEIEGVTRYILSVTSPGEPVFTFPEHGMYNFFTNRPAVGRFPIAGIAWLTKEYQSELLSSLKEAKPRYVIFGKNLSNLAKSIGRKEELLPDISAFIKEHYDVVKSFNTVDIYRLR